MNYDEMTIESLANDCFEKSGYKINKADLESRIQHLCDKYHQDKLNDLSQHLVSKCELTGEDMIEFSKYISSKGYEHRLNIMPNALIKFYLENRDSIIENNNVC